jgi:hypothetical protein
MSDVPDLDYNTSQDFTAAYKVRTLFILCYYHRHQFSSAQKYTVYRKMPMIVGKHARTLAIDGPYIHVRYISHFFSCFSSLNLTWPGLL